MFYVLRVTCVYKRAEWEMRGGMKPWGNGIDKGLYFSPVEL